MQGRLIAFDRKHIIGTSSLRNTYARRWLVAGRSHEEVSAVLGLTTHRTVVRLQKTIPD